ncbi:MAG: ABC transporter permease [Chloroflexi bacterium]|nr:ABC transporter permease [Chloroflexota bacterium]
MKRWGQVLRQGGLSLLGLLVFLALWEGLVRWQHYPPYILPPPELVAHKFRVALADGTLWRHTRVTLIEVLGGLVIGLSAATLLGYILAKYPLLERLVGPYVVAAQAIPVVAIAPLIILWAGSGIWSKMLVAALTLFFPTLVNTMVGIRSVEQDYMELMRVLNANRWQIFRLLELPAALPILLGGLKVGTALAVIGAVVGEFVAADQGLGFLINLTSRGTLDTALLFVAIGVLAFMAVSMYLSVGLLESRLLRWRTMANDS